MRYSVNNTWLEYSATGNRSFGKPEILLHHHDDLTAKTPWADAGFTIEKLFSEDEYAAFIRETHALLADLWRKAGLAVNAITSPSQYHQLVNSKEQHLRAIDQTKLLHTTLFPGGIERIEKCISKICHAELVALNPYDRQSVFHFRVIRPSSNDNNPLHRDIWLEDYASCINLYIPVAGSNEQSSLIIIPGSHRWSEARIERTESGALINGVKFNVPAVTDIAGDYTVLRPDPKENEVLVFSPYLIHGGAVNLNPDITRISIELRLWRK